MYMWEMKLGMYINMNIFVRYYSQSADRISEWQFSKTCKKKSVETMIAAIHLV